MAKVIALSNQKGGVGKTTTCINLGIGLVREGKKVLLIDLDPQGNLTDALGILSDSLSHTISDIMHRIYEREDIDQLLSYEEEHVKLHHDEGVDFIPANTELAGMESALLEVKPIERNFILKRYIDAVRADYDYILLDCQPSLGVLTINAFCSADSVIVPIQAQFLPLKGLQELFKTVERIRKRLNQHLMLEGILLTMVKPRTRMQSSIISLLRENYGKHLHIFKEAIPASVRVEETPAEAISIYAHDPAGKAAYAYRVLVEEVLANE
ncbi:MAG: AAA family ATPase [Clostridiaceae bacterium]|nr:AAA family ATPase [Clostridiaceae bacterium]